MIKINSKFILPIFISALPLVANSFDSMAGYAMLVDNDSGKVLYSKNSDIQMAPSSMSKLMTLYVAFSDIQNGKLKLADEARISEKAWKMEGSKMFLEVDKKATISDLLRGIIVQSGNDASVALAEHISGDEKSFVERMNAAAKEIGLTSSHFANATGLPDPEHYMTAQDLVTLGRALLKDFGDNYNMFSEKEFSYNNITQPNRNYLLGEDGIDGMKTGHTDSGGYGIIASAQRDGQRLIAVVNGLSSENERLEEVKKLLNHGFSNFQIVSVAKANTSLKTIPVWYGNKSEVAAILKEDIVLALPASVKKDDITVKVKHNSMIHAPIEAGAHVADLIVTIPGQAEDSVYKLTAAEEVRSATLFGKLYDNIRARLTGAKTKSD